MCMSTYTCTYGGYKVILIRKNAPKILNIININNEVVTFIRSIGKCKRNWGTMPLFIYLLKSREIEINDHIILI